MTSSVDLDGVPETMLWVLYNRASEARRPDTYLHDPDCVRVYESIDYDFERSFGKPHSGHPMRSKRGRRSASDSGVARPGWYNRAFPHLTVMLVGRQVSPVKRANHTVEAVRRRTVRDRVGTTPPPLPDEIVEKTPARYVEAYEKLTGHSF